MDELIKRIDVLINSSELQGMILKETEPKTYIPTSQKIEQLEDEQKKEYGILQFISPFSIQDSLSARERISYIKRDIGKSLPFNRNQISTMVEKTKEMVTIRLAESWMKQADQHRGYLINKSKLIFRKEYENNKMKILLNERQTVSIIEESDYQKMKNGMEKFLKEVIGSLLNKGKDEELIRCLYEFWKLCLTIHPLNMRMMDELGDYYLSRLQKGLTAEEKKEYQSFKSDPIACVVSHELPIISYHIHNLKVLADHFEETKELVHPETFRTISQSIVCCGEELLKENRNIIGSDLKSMILIASKIPALKKLL